MRRAVISLKPNLLIPIVFILPVIIGFIMFKLLPIINVIYWSFCDFSIFNTPILVGFDNYIELFTVDAFLKSSLQATFSCLLFQVFFYTAYSVFLAIYLNNCKRNKTMKLTIALIPTILPNIVNVLVWSCFFNPSFGAANSILSLFSISPLDWFYGKTTVIATIVFIGIWENGFSLLALISALQQVPSSLYDSIKIDTDRFFPILRHVIFPSIYPTIVLVIELQILASLQIFIPAYAITHGGPAKSSYFLTYKLYIEAFQDGRFGYACSIACILAILCLATILLFRSFGRRYLNEALE